MRWDWFPGCFGEVFHGRRGIPHIWYLCVTLSFFNNRSCVFQIRILAPLDYRDEERGRGQQPRSLETGRYIVPILTVWFSRTVENHRTWLECSRMEQSMVTYLTVWPVTMIYMQLCRRSEPLDSSYCQGSRSITWDPDWPFRLLSLLRFMCKGYLAVLPLS